MSLIVPRPSPHIALHPHTAIACQPHSTHTPPPLLVLTITPPLAALLFKPSSPGTLNLSPRLHRSPLRLVDLRHPCTLYPTGSEASTRMALVRLDSMNCALLPSHRPWPPSCPYSSPMVSFLPTLIMSHATHTHPHTFQRHTRGMPSPW